MTGDLQTWNYGTVDMSGGSVYILQARDTSAVTISGGSVWEFNVDAAVTVDISGGSVTDHLYAQGNSTVNLSGGSMSNLWASGTSAVTFHARDFYLGSGLSLDGDRVLGTGILGGEWFDGTSWTVNIGINDPGATIQAVPEPATMSLLALGLAGLFVRRRKRN